MFRLLNIIVITACLLGLVILLAAFPRLWLGLWDSGDSGIEIPPVPACRNWKEVGRCMRAIAADPTSDAAVLAEYRFRDHEAMGSGIGEEDPLLWLVWMEMQLKRRPELTEPTGFRPDDEVFRAARESHGFRRILTRLREGRPMPNDLRRMASIRHPEFLVAALAGLGAGSDATGTRLIIDALVAWGDPRVVPALVDVTEGGPEHRRTYASQSIARLHDPETVLLLIHKLGAETRTERFSAHTGLLRITGEEISRDDRRAWVEHFRANRDRYPPQLLPAGLEEEAILTSGR